MHNLLQTGDSLASALHSWPRSERKKKEDTIQASHNAAAAELKVKLQSRNARSTGVFSLDLVALGHSTLPTYTPAQVAALSALSGPYICNADGAATAVNDKVVTKALGTFGTQFPLRTIHGRCKVPVAPKHGEPTLLAMRSSLLPPNLEIETTQLPLVNPALNKLWLHGLLPTFTEVDFAPDYYGVMHTVMSGSLRVALFRAKDILRASDDKSPFKLSKSGPDTSLATNRASLFLKHLTESRATKLKDARFQRIQDDSHTYLPQAVELGGILLGDGEIVRRLRPEGVKGF